MFPSNYPTPPPRSRRRLATSVGLGVAGLVTGVAIAWTASASASSSTSSSTSGIASAALAATSSSSTAAAPAPGDGHGYHAPGTSGTVTAVSSDSVTIKTSAGTTTYAVDSSSDIDKNGEAQLSDLKAGDTVTFDVTTTNGKQTIDHLHAGNESLDRPTGGG